MMVKFSNTRQNKQLRDFLIFLFILLIVEAAAAIFISTILLKNTTILFFLIAIVTVFVTLIICSSISLLISSHKLNDNYLIIKLGRRFKGKKIVLDSIISIKKNHEINHPKPDSLGIVDKRKDDTFYCLGSSKNRYLLQLREPILIRAKDIEKSSKRGYVEYICINIDDKDLFEEKMAKFLVIENNEAKSDGKTNFKIPNAQSSKIVEQLPKQTGYSIVELPIEKPSESAPILEIKNLVYAYNDHIAVNEFNLCVEKGTICAFLGHNGAGKSTTLKMLTGLLKPQKGSVYLNQQDIWTKEGSKERRTIGFVPDTPILYKRLTAREHLYYSGQLWGIPDDILEQQMSYWLETLQLTKWQDQIIDTYSQGMQRKVSFALALLADPDLLIVDELTNAFDAMTLATIKETFRKRKQQGKSILFSGHVMAVAEEIADYITIIQQGQNVVSGTMTELKAIYGENKNLEEIFLSLSKKNG